MAESVKANLIDQLREFIIDYDEANVRQIVKSILNPNITEEELASWYDPEARSAFYEEVAMELADQEAKMQEGNRSVSGDLIQFGGVRTRTSSQTGSNRSSSRSSSKGSNRSNRSLRDSWASDSDEPLGSLPASFPTSLPVMDETNIQEADDTFDEIPEGFGTTLRASREETGEIPTMDDLFGELSLPTRSSSNANSRKGSRSNSSRSTSSLSAQDILEKREKLANRLMQHDANVEMMNDVVTNLESSKITQDNLDECRKASQTLTNEVLRLTSLVPKQEETPWGPVSTREAASSSSRPAATAPSRRFVQSSTTGRPISVRIGCKDRQTEGDCVIANERNPCAWVPGNNPPCLTGTEIKKMSKGTVRSSSGSVAAVPTQISVTQRAMASRMGTLPSATSTRTAAANTNEAMKLELMSRVGGRGTKASLAFNNYLRAIYGPSRTIAKLTTDQYKEALKLTSQEIDQIVEQYAGVASARPSVTQVAQASTSGIKPAFNPFA